MCVGKAVKGGLRSKLLSEANTDNYGVSGGRMGRGWMTEGILDPKQYFYRGA